MISGYFNFTFEMEYQKIINLLNDDSKTYAKS